MFAMLSRAFLLGLATAPFCAAACAPVFLPVVLSREKARFGAQAAALGEFLLGRLVAYAAVGLVVGWIGGAASAKMPPWAMPAATALLGAALLLYAVSETTHESAFCRAVKRWGRGGTFPLLLGFLTGANICPPFVMAMTDTLRAGGALNGLAYFIAFFAATSLVSLPLLALALGSFLPAVQSLGRVACGVVGFLSLCAAASYVAPAAGSPVEILDVKPETALLQQLLPEARDFREVQKPVRHFVGTTGLRKVGIVVFSSDLAPEVRGFGGHVPVAVALDPDGRIVDVRVLPNEETPGYGDRASAPEFAAQFRGKRYSDPLTLGHGVDGITGATITSSAVTDGVRLTARRAAEQVLGLSAPGAAPARRVRFNLWHLAVPAFFILAWIGESQGLRRLRPFVLAASVLCLGFGLKAFFSLIHILDIAAGEVPPLGTHALWYLLTALALGSALLAGRLYCAWICPFGAITELLGRLFRSPLEISVSWDRRLRRVKYGVLLILPLIYVIWRNADVLYVEPFSDTFTLGFMAAGSDAAWRIAWLIFLGVASLFVFRFFCRYLCPAGAAMAFFARHRLFGRIRPNRCLECGECMVSCPRKKDWTPKAP
jgi:Na+-translocating ferredoxin:NAD+ oxidoreductase RnfG subunit/ferredoxin/sulfite exporter TauE/SafE